jgi:hypothetical protein
MDVISLWFLHIVYFCLKLCVKNDSFSSVIVCSVVMYCSRNLKFLFPNLW